MLLFGSAFHTILLLCNYITYTDVCLPVYCTILYLLYSLLHVSVLNLGHPHGATRSFEVYSIFGNFYTHKWQTIYICVCVCVCVYIHTHTHTYTRWFKYDRDYLCVNKSQFVPVIFEPPCTYLLAYKLPNMVWTSKRLVAPWGWPRLKAKTCRSEYNIYKIVQQVGNKNVYVLHQHICVYNYSQQWNTYIISDLWNCPKGEKNDVCISLKRTMHKLRIVHIYKTQQQVPDWVCAYTNQLLETLCHDITSD